MGNSRGNSEFSVMVELFVKMIQSFLGQPLELILAEVWLIGLIVFSAIYFKLFIVLFLIAVTLLAVNVVIKNYYDGGI